MRPDIRSMAPVTIGDTVPDDEELPQEFRAMRWAVQLGGRPAVEYVEDIKNLYARYPQAHVFPS